MAVTNNPENGWDHDGFAKISSYIPESGDAIQEIIKKFEEEKLLLDEAGADQSGGNITAPSNTGGGANSGPSNTGGTQSGTTAGFI